MQQTVDECALYTLQHTATHCIILQHTATHCNTLQHTATHCNTLQHTTTSGITLKHTAASPGMGQEAARMQQAVDIYAPYIPAPTDDPALAEADRLLIGDSGMFAVCPQISSLTLGVLWCVVVCCNVLQRVAVALAGPDRLPMDDSGMLQSATDCVAVCCRVLQCIYRVLVRL